MKKGKLVSLISLTMANLVGLSLVTLAWFTAKQKVESGTNNIVAYKEDVVEDVKFYPFDTTKHGTKKQYYFSTTPVSQKDLGKYSIINSGYQLLVEIDLISTINASVVAETTADSYLGNVSVNEDGSLNYTLQEKGNSLSSIVCFYGFSADKVGTTDDGLSFSVNLDNSIAGKKNLINDSYTDLLPTKSNKICEAANINKLFLVVDYDEISIEKIYSANLGNNITSGAGENMTTDEDGHTYIEYVADFKLVVRKAASNE